MSARLRAWAANRRRRRAAMAYWRAVRTTSAVLGAIAEITPIGSLRYMLSELPDVVSVHIDEGHTTSVTVTMHDGFAIRTSDTLRGTALRKAITTVAARRVDLARAAFMRKIGCPLEGATWRQIPERR